MRDARAKSPVDIVMQMYKEAPDCPLPEFILGAGGPIAQAMQGYRVRPGQIQVANLISDVFKNGGHAAIEAGTGIGKTLAAIAGGIEHTLMANADVGEDEAFSPLVISTAQIALQDQLIKKDVPFMEAHMGLPFSWHYLKGRANWACNAAIEGAIHPRSTFARWLADDRTGDLTTSPLEIPPDIRAAITVEPEDCCTTKCAWFQECYYFTARRKCRLAHLVIVNHALLIANALAGGAIFGHPCAIIVDEAHKLEDVARGVLTVVINAETIHRVVKGALFSGMIDKEEANAVQASARAFEREVKNSFGDLRGKVRVENPAAAVELTKRAKSLFRKIQMIRERVEGSRAYEGSVDAANQMLPSIRVLYAALFYLQGGEGATGDLVVWVERPSPRANPELHVAPLSVAEFLAEEVWNVPSVLMSATMVSSADAGFSTIVDAVGLPDPVELVAQSAFDFRAQLRYLLPQWRELKKPPHDSDPKVAAKLWADQITVPMFHMLRMTDGRSFCLFTAGNAMNEVCERIRAMAPPHWTILVQGDGSKNELVAKYKAATNPVLFGLESFWEGVDIPGSLLSAVHVDRIPFPAPGQDPVEDALREAAGGFPKCMGAYDIPRAILKLRQAFGRVIRSETCLGLGILWDPRLRHGNYRNTVLNALPGFVEPLDRGEFQKIPGWLAGTGPPPLYEVPF